jgi:chorismate lyase/3-hydroxybenzoate synthase
MPDCPYSVRYEAPDAPLTDDILLRVRFGRPQGAAPDARDLVVPLDPLTEAPAETWRSRGTVTRGREEGIDFAHDGQVLLGSVLVDEAGFRDPEQAGEQAYRRMERVLRGLGYPNWLRVWNYLSDITRGDGDDERYRQFVVGRYRALANAPDFERHLPAATAIGTSGGGLMIFFLAAKSPGEQIENPRQVSAFRYPREYGPRSPSFSRATLKTWDDRADLYVSGTASVVGHESRHVGDALAQLAEVRSNVDALLALAREKCGGRAFVPQQLKLYVRDRANADQVVARARELFGESAPLIALVGEICRTDLLLEVEGLYSTP